MNNSTLSKSRALSTCPWDLTTDIFRKNKYTGLMIMGSEEYLSAYLEYLHELAGANFS